MLDMAVHAPKNMIQNTARFHEDVTEIMGNEQLETITKGPIMLYNR